jgi:outer membrane immunogenic protein
VTAPITIDPWTGFYLGGNVGYSAGRLGHSTATTFIVGTSAGLTDTTSARRSLDGVIGGGQIGWNWRLAPNWIWGIETDFQASDQKVHNTAIVNTFAAGAVQTQTTLSEQKLDWFGTVRLRGGYVTGNALWYVTGGYAYGKISSNESALRGPGAVGFAAFAGAGNVSSTRGGWTLGGGAETKLSDNWSAKIEYLYMDLGTLTNGYTVFTTAAAPAAVFASNSKFEDHIIRFGVNYSFR